MKTKSERVLSYLLSGRPLTSSTASSRFGLRSLRSLVRTLREQGYCVYTNRRDNHFEFRIGKPSRSIVRAAYRLKGAEIFN